MAIKITKSGRKTFDAACPQCGCEFTYELEDVHLFGVTCPECGWNFLHPNQRDKDDEKRSGLPDIDTYVECCMQKVRGEQAK